MISCKLEKTISICIEEDTHDEKAHPLNSRRRPAFAVEVHAGTAEVQPVDWVLDALLGPLHIRR